VVVLLLGLLDGVRLGLRVRPLPVDVQVADRPEAAGRSKRVVPVGLVVRVGVGVVGTGLHLAHRLWSMSENFFFFGG
jgi:hypothetical protein